MRFSGGKVVIGVTKSDFFSPHIFFLNKWFYKIQFYKKYLNNIVFYIYMLNIIIKFIYVLIYLFFPTTHRIASQLDSEGFILSTNLGTSTLCTQSSGLSSRTKQEKGYENYYSFLEFFFFLQSLILHIIVSFSVYVNIKIYRLFIYIQHASSTKCTV